MELEFHQLRLRYSELRISLPIYEARLTASLASEGQLHPVLVVSGASGIAGQLEEYVLVDGYRRVKALERLGRDTVESMVLPLEESAALLFHHTQERGHPRTALEDGWLFRELIARHGMSQAEISRGLQRSESWVSRRLSLVRELPENAHRLVRRGELCAYGAMKYLVPLARAKRGACKELVVHLSGRRTSARELEQLYEAWKQGDAEQRKRVISNPKLFLKVTHALKQSPLEPANGSTEDVSRDIAILEAVSGRARRRIRGTTGPLSLSVKEGWRSAKASFLALSAEMERRNDAGSRATRRDPSVEG